MEKIIASASKQFVIVADHTKQVSVLGARELDANKLSPGTEAVVSQEIHLLLSGALVQLRQYTFDNPFVTEEGHQILDCLFGEIPDPAELGRKLDAMPGVVEHGLFVGMANVVLVAQGTEIIELRR